MNDQMMTFSKRAAVSYAWNKSQMNGKSTIASLLKCTKVLTFSIFRKHQVQESKALVVYNSDENIRNTVFGKEYKKRIDERNITVQQPTLNYFDDKIHETAMLDVDDERHETAILDVDDKIHETAMLDVDDKSHEAEIVAQDTDSLSSNSTLNNVYISDDQLKELIANSSFLNNVRYVVQKNVIYSNNENLTMLPRYLEVHGDFDLSNCINLTGLPIDLIVNGDLNLYGCLNLIAVPKHFIVDGEINVISCPVMEDFPKNFIPGSMVI